MAIAAAHAIAGYAEKKGLSPQYIIPTMLDTDMVPFVASEVAAAAVSEGIARNPITKNEVKTLVANDIEYSIELSQQLSESGLVKDISDDFVKKIVDSVAAEYL